MASAVVMPVLLEQKEHSLVERVTQVPAALARQAVKQVQWLLSYSNGNLGQPFLQGNFAPQLSEVFTVNLPLVTAAGTAAGTAAVSAKAAASKAAAAAGAAGDGSNGVHHAAQNGDSNGLANGHANGHVEPAAIGADADNDVKQQRDTFHSSKDTNGSSSSSSSLPQLCGSLDKLPAGLAGVFLRVGPNPLLKPLGGYHWFDGDGMVHAVRLKGGAAAYCNRWVPTARLAQESAAGWPMFLKLGDYVGLGGLGLIFLERCKTALGIVDKTAGGGTANTALACHAGRLLALNEGDMPYALRVMCDGLVESLGRVAVTGTVGRSFTAHPKLDPVTDELHFFRYTFDAPPYVSYGVLGPKGDLTASLDISAANMKRPVMMHDFAITQNWVVFMDNPLCFDGERMVKQRNLPFSFKAEQGSRVGLLPRGAADDSGMVWFDLPAHMAFHVANAWEEADGTVKLFVCHSESISLNLDTRTEGAIPSAEQPGLAVITLDPNSSSSSSSSSSSGRRVGELRLMTETSGDFPTINPRFVGRKQRYAYVATMVTGFGAAVKWDGVAKMDLWAPEGSDAMVAKIQLPPGCYNGETVFVPRHEDPIKCTSEDDGYLVTYVHDETASSSSSSSSSSGGSSSSSGSSLVVWDAATMQQQPLAVVALPQRVPYGFHGLWVPEHQFQQQLTSQPLQPTSLMQ